MANTQNVFTKHAKAIVDALKGNPDGLTIAELNEVTGMEIKSGHVVGAAKKGLIEVIGEREVERPAKRKVATYVYVTSDVLNKEDGKPFNYTDGETAVLAAAATFEGPFTLADLAVALNKERMSSGSINGLVKKGNITKGENDREIATIAKSSVNVYGFVKDIPADAEIR
jgi:hypothetical protein